MKRGLVVLGIAFCTGFSALASECTFKSEPEIIYSDDRQAHFVWDSEDEAALERANPLHSSPLVEFREKISKDLPQSLITEMRPDPWKLLKRDREIYAAVAPEHLPAFDRVLSGEIGRIRRNGCLEDLLFTLHLEIFGLDHPTSEFQAYLLKRNGLLRTYFSTGSSSRVPPSARQHILPRIKADLNRGWTDLVHIHSHPFILPPGSWPSVGGRLLPSPADIAGYRQNPSLHEARITNGFDTLILHRPEFSPVRTPAPSP